VQGKEPEELPETEDYEYFLEGFPTVGAEFHFPVNTPSERPYFWQRIALLNMSQYQLGSYVQLSRNDRDVIEVRMNPSYYPVTIANWNHMRLILGELNQSYFTSTINRGREGNFSWSEDDSKLINKLRSLGMLSYASVYDNVPNQDTREEINFGSIYLGQTVRVDDKKYDFSGLWAGKEGKHGQMGIYVGYGNNFPYLAYYPSMALVKPEILNSVPNDLFSRVRTLNDALAVSNTDIENAFSVVYSRIQTDPRLRDATEAGNKIMEMLNP
jgi:hypothetical protein